ncbi:hypothetical protein [Paenibacillus flagellatus]|uniref:Uncharacterized protein n=1 Tax=Paenibacillus flagellatus TaxID=2211139 RepID=A0A2V5KXF5_9BACL|nr:hypothetical protein [Paenibacillus flagellatus]PYI54496.1 hypothetical protein DLM86_13605 [Paenibacillus flagellatus]
MSQSKRAVWLAASSDKGDRLLQIALEHTRLARRISEIRKMGLRAASALYDRIDELRRERDEIIAQFEGR